MQLTHSFRIPVGVDEAWAVLRDIERIAPCMPGATIDSVEGDDFTGGVKVKVGPITMTYKGEASFVDIDEEHHRAAIEAKGRETRGSGTARATVRAELRQVGDETEVTMITDLAVTGKPAQFGRGVMADVGGKLIDQFATCLSSTLAEAQAPAEAPVAVGAAGDGAGPDAVDVPVATPSVGAEGTGDAPAAERTGPAAAAGTTPTPPGSATGGTSQERRTDEAIDLLDVVGAPLLKRLGPVLGAFAGFVSLLWLLARRVRRRAAGLPSRRQRRKAGKADRRLAKADRKASKAEHRAAKAERGSAKAEHRAVRTSRRQRRRTRRAERTVARAAVADQPPARDD